MIGPALISRAEVAAALAKAIRVDALTQEEAVQVTEILIARADTLAWEHGLRGYDAVHLAAASLWQDAMREQVTLSTFDRRLWAAAKRVGLACHPPDLPALLDAWEGWR